MTTDFLGQLELEPDRYLGPKRYRIRYRCSRCHHQFSRVTEKLSMKDPPCPKAACKEAAIEEEVERRTARLKAMLDEQRAPAQIGGNAQVKAVDATAALVMEDYKLTDLKDNIREGEAMAPKLPPAQQAMADGFFTGEAVKTRNNIPARHLQAIAARALRGGYRGMALNPAEVVPGKRGDPPLRSIGMRPIG